MKMFDLDVFKGTAVENFNYNRVILSGKIIDNIQFIFETKKTKFYRTVLYLRRNNNKKNYVSILFNENILRTVDIKRGDYVTVCGYIRCSDRIIFKDNCNQKDTLRNTETMISKPKYVDKLVRFTDVFAMQITKKVINEKCSEDLITKEDSKLDNDTSVGEGCAITIESSDKDSNDESSTEKEDTTEKPNTDLAEESDADLNLVEICGTIIQKAEIKVINYEKDDSKVYHKKALACSIKINPSRKDNLGSDKNSHFVVSCLFWGKIINVIKSLPKSYSVRLIGKIEKTPFSNYHDWIDSSYVVSSFLITEIKYCN